MGDVIIIKQIETKMKNLIITDFSAQLNLFLSLHFLKRLIYTKDCTIIPWKYSKGKISLDYSF